MDWSLKLMESKDKYYSLIAHMKGHQIIQYIVVSGYNAEEKFGQQWAAGHYFGMELENAVNFINERNLEVA